MLLTLAFGGWEVLSLPAVAYLGARIGGPARAVGAKNDYSYGIYVCRFLVQQVLAYFGVYRWGYAPFTLIALAVSLRLAWLSWHGIEKRAMALRDWGPGRGWRSGSGAARVEPTRSPDARSRPQPRPDREGDPDRPGYQ